MIFEENKTTITKEEFSKPEEPQQQIPNKKKKYYFIFIAILFIIILLIIIFIFKFSSSNLIEAEFNSEFYERADKEGLSYCNMLKDEEMKNKCIERYLILRATNEQNPKICEEGTTKRFVEECKTQSIFKAVMQQYFKEAEEKNNQDIIPSNIYLCETLNNLELIEICKNPKKIIEGCPDSYVCKIIGW